MSSIKGKPFKPYSKPISGLSGTTGRNSSTTTPPDLTNDGFSKEYYTNFLSDSFTHGNPQSMWSGFFSALAYAQKNGLGFEELLAMLSKMGMNSNAKNSYLQQIYEAWLAQATKEEQRDYDKSALAEQRIYDSPTNQLARLMGAGISRDAAIQMLSGGSGDGSGSGSALVGSGAQSGLQSTVDPVNVLNGSLNTANTVINGFATIASFAKMGVSMSQMDAATSGQRIQNSLNEKQLQGINSANALVTTFGNLVADGTLSQADMDGFQNASQLLQYALDHKDTEAFKPLFDSGEFQNVYSTSFGRNALSSLWRDLLDTKTSGRQLDQKLNQVDNQITLQNLTKEQFINSIFSGLISNKRALVGLQQDIQDLLDGTIQLQIDGEILSQEKINTLLMEFNYNQAATENEIFDAVYNTPDENGLTGADFASQQQLNELYKYATVSACERSALTEEWQMNYKRAFFEDGRNILLSLLLKNAYSQGSLDLYTEPAFGANGAVDPEYGTNTTNTLGRAVILMNQTPLLQGVRLITPSVSDEFNGTNPFGAAVKEAYKAQRLRRAARRRFTGH